MQRILNKLRPLFRSLILLALINPVSAQSVPGKKITLEEAVSEAIHRHPTLSAIQAKELAAEVESTYFDHVYLINRYNILQQQISMTGDLERVASLRYDAGDIDLLEKTRMISGLGEIRNAIDRMNDEMAICANKLKIILLTSEQLIPADSVLTMYAIQKHDGNYPADSSDRFIFEKERENLEFELNSSFKKILYFNEIGLIHAEIMLESSRIRLEKEDIDYAEYAGNVGDAFQIQLDFLQTLKKYNQTAIQLELYAY